MDEMRNAYRSLVCKNQKQQATWDSALEMVVYKPLEGGCISQHILLTFIDIRFIFQLTHPAYNNTVLPPVNLVNFWTLNGLC